MEQRLLAELVNQIKMLRADLKEMKKFISAGAYMQKEILNELRRSKSQALMETKAEEQ